MTDDLKLPRMETARPGRGGSPSRHEKSHCDGRSSFNLLLRGQRDPSADDRALVQTDRPDVATEKASDREPTNASDRRHEIAQAGTDEDIHEHREPPGVDEGEPVPVSSPTVATPPAFDDPASAARGTGGESDSPDAAAVPANGEGGADEAVGVLTSQMANPVADAFGMSGFPSAVASAAAPSIGGPPVDRPMSSEDATASVAIMLAALSCGTGTAIMSVSPAGPFAVAAAPAATHTIAATGVPLSPAPAPSGGGSMTVHGDNTAVPANDANSTAVPSAAALKNETSSDERPMQQGKDQGDFRHPGVAAATPAAETFSTTIAGAKPAVPSRHLPDQIAIHMAHGARNGLSRLHIALDPESLGRLDIRIEFHRDGRLNATIVADRPETLNLLRSEAVSLQESLNAAGFKANSDSFSFDLSSNGDRTPGHAETPTRSSGWLGNGDDTSDDAPLATPIWRPVAAGRVDIRA